MGLTVHNPTHGCSEENEYSKRQYCALQFSVFSHTQWMPQHSEFSKIIWLHFTDEEMEPISLNTVPIANTKAGHNRPVILWPMYYSAS